MRWSDGSLQLLIGNEVLDISVQDAQHDQAHLFLRHEKVKVQITLCVIHQYIFDELSFHHKSGKAAKRLKKFLNRLLKSCYILF